MNRREFVGTALGVCLFGLFSGKGVSAADIEKLTPIQRLFYDYIDNMFAYISHTKINGHYPDERLMRSIEDKLDIPEQSADDFRRMIAGYIGQVMWKNKPFDWDTHPELKKAFELEMKERRA